MEKKLDKRRGEQKVREVDERTGNQERESKRRGEKGEVDDREKEMR